MKKIVSYCTILIATLVFAACGEDPQAPPVADPASIQITEVQATMTTVSFTLTPEKAIAYEYKVALTDAIGQESFIRVPNAKAQTIKVENLEPGKEYTIAAFAYNENQEKSQTVTATVTTDTQIRPTVEIGEFACTWKGATVSVSTENATKLSYVFHLRKENAPARDTWKTVDVTADTPVALSFPEDGTWAEAGYYTLTACASDAIADGNTIYKNFVIPAQPAPLTIEVVRAEPTVIEVKFTPESDLCSKYVFKIADPMTYTLDEFKTEAPKLASKTEEVTEIETPWMRNIIRTVFVMWYDKDGKAQEPIVKPIDIQDFVFGLSNASITIEPKATTYQSLEYTMTPSENCVYYNTCVMKKGTLTQEQAIDAWKEMKWTKNSFSGPKTETVQNLDTDAEYYILAVGTTPEGELGTVACVTHKTASIPTDGTAKAIVESSAIKPTQFTMSFKKSTDCAAIRTYMISQVEYDGAKHNDISILRLLATKGEGVITFTRASNTKTYTNLAPKKVYYVFTLPESADNHFGAMTKEEVTLPPFTFDSPASVVPTVTGFSTVDGTVCKAKVSLAANSTCKKMYSQLMDPSVYEGLTRGGDIRVATAIVIDGGASTTVTVASATPSAVTYTGRYGSTYKLVVICEDADGKFGPIVTTDVNPVQAL